MQWIACSHRLDIITIFYIQEVVCWKDRMAVWVKLSSGCLVGALEKKSMPDSRQGGVHPKKAKYNKRHQKCKPEAIWGNCARCEMELRQIFEVWKRTTIAHKPNSLQGAARRWTWRMGNIRKTKILAEKNKKKTERSLPRGITLFGGI